MLVLLFDPTHGKIYIQSRLFHRLNGVEFFRENMVSEIFSTDVIIKTKNKLKLYFIVGEMRD